MLNIIWTDLAIEDVSDNIEYLENEWSENEVIRFNLKIHQVLNQISKGTIECNPTEYDDVFKIVIIKQITLFYKIDKSNIILLRFWNTYQHPNKLRF
jgi:plasmid stabilization system protein ParE